jgi:hypothetical protein
MSLLTIPSLRDRAYLRNGRLEDVLALIQVLALDEHAHRSDNGLAEELQGKPDSARTWTEIARGHPEFFRIGSSGNHVVSLVARHVTPRVGATRETLSAEFTSKLLETAISLHDRQVRRAERWVFFIPLLVALMTSITALIVATR